MGFRKFMNAYINKKVIVKYLLLAVLATSIILGGSYRVDAEMIAPDQITTLAATNSVRINNMVFTLNSVSASKSNQYRTAAEGNKLVCINLTVTNQGTKQEQLTSIMMFKLYDKTGKNYNIVLPEGPDSINGLLSPGQSKTGTVWFEVPQGLNQFELHIRPSMMSQETGILAIQVGGAYAQ